jgi:hypothetical protein
MIEDHRILHRITHGKISAYCGYSEASATLHYFKLEPQATPKKPVEWHQIVKTDEGPNVGVAKRLLRRAPGPDLLTETIGDE